MKAKDVFMAACGMDDFGDNKALVKVQTGFVDRNSLEETVIEHLDMDRPVVEIHQNARLTIVNLVFEESSDPDFVCASEMIKGFQTIETSMDDERTPGITVTIMPKGIEGSFIHGVSGIAILQSQVPGGAFDTVSIIFTNDCIHAYMLDLDQIDPDQYE